MEKYKVLIAHNYYKIPGGEDTVVQNEKKLLEDNGHKVITYFRTNEEINSGGIGKVRLFFHTIFNYKTYKEVKDIIAKEEIDIVHVHNTLPLISPSIYYASFSSNIPIVQTIHNFRLLCANGSFYRDEKVCEDCVEKGLKQSIKHKCYRKSYLQTIAVYCMLKFHRLIGTYQKVNGYITLTRFNKQKMEYLIKDYSKIFIKPNFMYDTNILRKERDIKDYFIYLGRLDAIKGIKVLLESWKEADSKLYIIGTGEEKEYVEDFIKDNKELNIEYLGFMNKNEAFKYLVNAKALIVPSKWYEGFPMTIVESFSLGVPVIASRIGNLQSIIDHGKNGLLFDDNNKEDLIRQINKINDDSELARNLGICAYQTFNKYYTNKINYEQLINIYEEVKVR